MTTPLFQSDAHTGPALVDTASERELDHPSLRAAARDAVASLSGARRLLAVICDNSLASVLPYLGALLEGHPVALLDGSAKSHLVAGVIEAYGMPHVAGPTGTADRLRAAGVDVRAVAPTEHGELIRTAHPEIEDLHPELALLLSTSGTTGSTKFVRLSRRNVDSNARAIAAYLGLSPRDRPITSLPLHYTFGLSVLNSHLAAGATVVLSNETMMQTAFWSTFREHECTGLAGVPYTYAMLERLRFRRMDLPSLDTMQQAGGALAPELQDAYRAHMEERGGRFFVMYGQTEATARIAYVPPERLAEKLGSAGVAIDGGEITVEDDGGVVYRGPNVMLGYAECAADLARGDELGGELRTGDLGRLDDDGFLFLTGRRQRFAKIFGLRIGLDDVELRLRAHGPAAAVADGETVRAFCAFGTDEELDALRRDLAREFGVNASAFVLSRVDEIPTTSSDKVDYRRVERWLTS